MTRVKGCKVSFSHLPTVYFSLFTGSKNAAGLPAIARGRHDGPFGQTHGTFFQHSTSRIPA